MFGNIPQSIQFLEIIDKGSVTTDSHISSSFIEMSSWLLTLLTFIFLIILRISYSSNLTVFSL